MAARRLRPGEKVLEFRAAEDVEGYEVHSLAADEAPEQRILTDTPPGAYVSRLPTEHGEVRVAPWVDDLLRRVRARRARGPPKDGAA